jgi:hypothetical protein
MTSVILLGEGIVDSEITVDEKSLDEAFNVWCRYYFTGEKTNLECFREAIQAYLVMEKINGAK